MSIENKLTYLDGTKQALKEAINNLGGDITSETTFREYAQELDQIYDNIPKTTDTGTNLSLTTIKGKMNIIPKGDTYQYTTTGKNLFNIDTPLQAGSTSYINLQNNSFTLDKTNNRVMNFNHTSISLPAGTYTMFFRAKPNQVTITSGTLIGMYIKDSNQNNLANINFQYNNSTGYAIGTATISETGSYIYFFLANSEASSTTAVISDVMILSGSYTYSNILPYEPYTNGASPNPTYPQNIEVVTGTQEVKVENVNLLDIENGTYTNNENVTAVVNNGKITINGTSGSSMSTIKIPFVTTLNGTYTMSANNTAIGDTTNWTGFRLQSDNSTTVSSTQRTFTNANANITFALTNQSIQLFVIRIGTSTTFTNYEFTPQLEKGSVATSYTPHQEQTQTISLGDIELCKIGNYQDYLYKSGDKWYKKENIGKQIFTGDSSEYWNTSGTSTSGYNRFTSALLYNLILKPTATSQIADIMSNYFIKKSADNTYAKIEGISVGTNGNLYIYADSLKEYTKEQFTTWLSTHNMEVRYVLATPQDIEITDTNLKDQLNNLEKAQSYNGTTNITSNGNLPMVLSVSALKGSE